MNAKKGYTLIELVVIISVLLILSALAIPSFFGVRDRARISEAVHAANALRIAQTLYRDSHPKMYYAHTTNQLLNYTSVTALLRAFEGSPTLLTFTLCNCFPGCPPDPCTEAGGNRYTLTARAKDSQTTMITATESGVKP